MTNRLFDAVASIRYRQIEILLQCGVDINTKDDNGKTVLMIACDIADDKKRYKMFRYLMHRGADEFETNQEGVSVFQYACAMGRTKIVKRMMKEKGLHVVHLPWKDDKNRLALYHAVISGKIDIIRSLIIAMKKQNISVDQVDVEGITPLILAYKLKYPKIADLLLQEGKANPRICDREHHLSATEWAEVCNNEIEEDKIVKDEKHREKRMIFPRIDHVVFRRKLARKKQREREAYRLPTVDDSIISENGIITTNSYSRTYPQNGKQSWTTNQSQTQTSESSVYSHVSRGNQVQSVHGKSIDSAMELLELASRGGEKRQYATSFVASELDTTKMHDSSLITSMMDAYSIQNSQSFRKTVIPQSKPVPRPPPTRETKKRVSTLAIIMNRGGRSTASRTRRASRGSNKTIKRQPRPGTRQRKHSKQHLSKVHTTSVVQTASHEQHAQFDDVNESKSLQQIPEEVVRNKRSSKISLHKNNKFPDVGMRLVTQGVR